MSETLAIVALESQVAVLTALVAEMRRDVNATEIAVGMSHKELTEAVAHLAHRLAVLEARVDGMSWPRVRMDAAIHVPESPLLPEAAPRGPQAAGAGF